MASADAAARPRVLVVAQDFPWPAVTGSMIRLASVIEALAEHADVHLFCFVHADRDLPCELSHGTGVTRHQTATYREAPLTWRRRLRWLFSTTPLRLVTTNHDGVRPLFSGWAYDSYDLVWFSKAQTYEVLGRPRLGPTVVDLDDLEDQKIRAWLAVRASARQRPTLRQVGARIQARLDASRWRRVQRLIAAKAEHVTVCSEIDAHRFGTRATVLPNCYRLPARPAGGRPVREPASVLFAGLLYYPPNADAAGWLVEDVLPHLRRRLPGTTVRLVGAADPAVTRLEGRHGATVVGPVPEMQPELEKADLVVVPVRFGSGTRVKILEAFAHRLPVVSTTLGAEGLGARDGQHLLMADDAERFADACVRVLTDDALRAAIVSEGAALHAAQFTPAAALDVVGGLFTELTRHVPSAGR